MLVKICGITNPEDARTAQYAGADFIGLVFVETSKRFVTIDQARCVLDVLDRRAEPVALFVDRDIPTILQIVEPLGIRTLQLHGHESPDDLNSLMRQLPQSRVIKAFTVTGPQSVLQMQEYYRSIRNPDRVLAFLLDGPGGGGAGMPFDWKKIAEIILPLKTTLPSIFLAGGLTIENLPEAIETMKPDGVDVSSGVETTPGKKDSAKVRKFIHLAKNKTQIK